MAAAVSHRCRRMKCPGGAVGEGNVWKEKLTNFRNECGFPGGTFVSGVTGKTKADVENGSSKLTDDDEEIKGRSLQTVQEIPNQIMVTECLNCIDLNLGKCGVYFNYIQTDYFYCNNYGLFSHFHHTIHRLNNTPLRMDQHWTPILSLAVLIVKALHIF